MSSGDSEWNPTRFPLSSSDGLADPELPTPGTTFEEYNVVFFRLATDPPLRRLDELHLENGDEVLVVRTDQGIMLTPFDPDFEAAMGAFETGRKKFRNALRELAQ